MFLQLVFLAVIGVYGVNGQFDRCSQEMLSEINNCISSTDDFKSMTPTSVVTFILSPTEAMCSKKTEFISLLKCMNDARLKCYDDNFKTLFPTNEMYEKTMDYLCTRINSFNLTCLLGAIVEIAPCFGKGLTTPSSNPSFDEINAFTCGSQKNGKKCTEDSYKLNECPETKKTFLELAKLSNPEACGGEAGFESGEFSSAPPLYQSLLLLITIALVKFIF